MDTIFINSMNRYYGMDAWNQFYSVFFNTGNAVFGEMCKKEINYQESYNLEDIAIDNVMRDKVYVLPVSNNLSPEDTSFTRMLYRLAKFNLNVVLIGVGVQASLNETPKDYLKKIPGRKKRLFCKMADNMELIGVRGPFTAECLELMGIHNVQIIGCPSFYSNLCKRKLITELPKGEYERVCVNWDLNSNNCYSIGGRNSKKEKCVIQTVPEYVMMKRHQLKKDANIFFNVETWSDWINQCAFTGAIGDRFHGNMICYLNNVPTVWIEKDVRVFELVETLGLPAIPANSKQRDIVDIFEKNQYSKDFYVRRNLLRQNYIDFLDKNGIAHNFEVNI